THPYHGSIRARGSRTSSRPTISPSCNACSEIMRTGPKTNGLLVWAFNESLTGARRRRVAASPSGTGAILHKAPTRSTPDVPGSIHAVWGLSFHRKGKEINGLCRNSHLKPFTVCSLSMIRADERGSIPMAISFKGAHFPKEIILTGVRWYVAYPLSYRHVEELMEERGVSVDHATLQRWVVKYSPQLEEMFHRRKR